MLERPHRVVPGQGAPGNQGFSAPGPAHVRWAAMNEAKPVDELRHRISQALRDSPVQDIEKNLHALLGAFFDRFDLATREDLDLQKKLLERAQAKLAALETRVAELEARKP
jgi:BMFP domain-containing protein YqiC